MNNKIVVKLTSSRATKRLGEPPENFLSLKEKCSKVARTQDFSITYTDNAGDVINVSDDEDLVEAYEVAEHAFGGQLQLNIRSSLNESVIEDKLPITQSYVQSAIKEAAATSDHLSQDSESEEKMDKKVHGGK
jgi:hypothetical protein